MFDPIWQRLIKESLIYVHQKHPWASSLPVYFLPWEPRPIEEIGKIVHAMQELPIIPWPQDNCIVMCQEFISSLVGIDDQTAHRTLVTLVRQRSDDLKLHLPDDSIGGHKLQAITSIYVPALNSVGHVEQNMVMRRISNPNARWRNIDESVADLLKMIRTHVAWMTDEQAEIMRQYAMATVPNNLTDFWMVNAARAPERVFGPQAIDQPGLAADILAYLSHLAVPCHYVVRSKFKDGFGPGPVRRATKGKVVTSLVSYERIMSAMPRSGTGGTPEYHVEPHKRRGHSRYFWQRAGIDRASPDIPSDPGQRLVFAMQKGVKSRYITPTWIGPRQFDQGDVSHEVIVTEFDLSSLDVSDKSDEE